MAKKYQVYPLALNSVKRNENSVDDCQKTANRINKSVAEI